MLGLIALLNGLLAVVLGAIPCLGLVTLPLPILGIILTVVAFVIAAHKREGFGVPVSSLLVNLVACVLPFLWSFVFMGLGMKSAEHAAQQREMEAEVERQDAERDEAERRQIEAANAASLVGLGAGPGRSGGLLCLTPLRRMFLPYGQSADALVVDLDQLVREFQENEIEAGRKYLGKTLVIQGKMNYGGHEEGHAFLNLRGATPDQFEVFCTFDDPAVPQPNVDRLKNQRVTVQGRCKGLFRLTGTVSLESCKLLK